MLGGIQKYVGILLFSSADLAAWDGAASVLLVRFGLKIWRALLWLFGGFLVVPLALLVKSSYSKTFLAAYGPFWRILGGFLADFWRIMPIDLFVQIDLFVDSMSGDWLDAATEAACLMVDLENFTTGAKAEFEAAKKVAEFEAEHEAAKNVKADLEAAKKAAKEVEAELALEPAKKVAELEAAKKVEAELALEAA